MPTGESATVGAKLLRGGGLGEGEEAEEAHGRLPIARDLEAAVALGVLERGAAVGDGERRAVVGGDDGVGRVELAGDDLERAARDGGAERAVAEHELDAGLEAVGEVGPEQGPEREN